MDDQARAAYESDIQEALWLNERQPASGSPDVDSLGELLGRIARARRLFAPSGEAHPYRDQFETLSRHIASLQARCDADHPHGEPMAPLIGWDLDASQHPDPAERGP